MKLMEIGSFAGAPNFIRNIGSSGSGEWSTAKPTKDQIQSKREDAVKRKAASNQQQLNHPSMADARQYFDDVVDEVKTITSNARSIAYDLPDYIRFDLGRVLPPQEKLRVNGMVTRLNTALRRMLNAIEQFDVSDLERQTAAYELARSQLVDTFTSYREPYRQKYADRVGITRIMDQYDQWITTLNSLQMDIES